MLGVEIKIVITRLNLRTKVEARVMQRHVIEYSLVIVFVAFLRTGFAADVSQQHQVRLSSLQQKIDELDDAGKYHHAIPFVEERLKVLERIVGADKPQKHVIARKNNEFRISEGRADYPTDRPNHLKNLARSHLD